MEVKLASIADGIEFQADEAQSFLNLSTGEVVVFTDEEIDAASSDEDMSEHAEWYREAVTRAKEYIENEENYIPLPSKFDFHEYQVMEKFIGALPIEEQRDELFNLIKGKGAFSRFRQGLERFLLLDKWYKYKEQAIIELAREWCEDNRIKYKN